MLVQGVEYDALVGVCCTFVAGVGQDDGSFLVGYVVDGEGVLIVSVADLTACELCIRAAVDEALCVVDVAIL